MRAFWRIMAIESRLISREITSFLFIVLFPALLAWLLGKQIQSSANQVSNAVAMLSLSPMLFGLMSFPMALVTYRERGMLRRLRMTPLSPAVYLVAQAVVGLALVLIGGALVIMVSRLVFNTPWPVQPALLLLAFALGGLAFIALGALLGSFIANTRTMQMLSVLVFGAMAFSLVLGQNGGTSVGSRIAAALPAHHLTSLVRTFWLGGAPLAWGSLAALAAVAVAGLAGALALFRWE